MGRDLLQELGSGRPLVIDGAMGSELYGRGVYINQAFEEINLKTPDLIREIHADYLKAGADILMTNTFNGNREKLKAFGLAGKVREVNLEGARIARAVAQDKAFVAGSMGPLGHNRAFGGVSEKDAENIFREQASALIDGEVDAIILETFGDLDEIKAAIRAVRAADEVIPILAFMSFGIDGTTLRGHRPEDVVSELKDLPVTVLGANCSTGPHAMLDTIQRMIAVSPFPIAAMPNAGAPRIVEGRTLYMATPDYISKFAKRFINAGCQLIGGCCGTSPEMIHEIANSVKALSPSRVEVVSEAPEEREKAMAPIPDTELSEMSRRLEAGEFLVSVEVRPPRGITAGALIRGIAPLKDHGVDFVNIPDSPRATVSMSPMSLALQIKESSNLETIIHFSCRDRNLLGMQSDLLGLHALGIRDILCVTGDPPHMGNYPTATAVFDVDAIGLTRMMSNFNRGLDLGGKSLKAVTGFYHGVGADPGALDLDREVDRYIQKVESGAKFMMTQPVFDTEIFAKFMKRIEKHRVKTLVGIMPFVSHKNCEFFHHEVPGVVVPEHHREIMRKAGTGPRAMREGVAIAREALDSVRELCDGAYIMAPLGRYKLPLGVLGALSMEEMT